MQGSPFELSKVFSSGVFPSLQSFVKMRPWGKKVAFGNNLENKFKVLNSENKKWVTGSHPGLKTFAGDLFKKTSWAYDLFYQEAQAPVHAQTEEKNAEVVKETSPVSLTFTSAVKELGNLVESTDQPLVRDNLELSSENWINFILDTDLVKKAKNSDETPLLAMFIGLNQNASLEKAPNEKQLELIVNMAKAMKLELTEYKVLSVSAPYFDRDDLEKVQYQDEPELRELISAVVSYKPKIIFSLGANMTNFFLKRREKLSTLHGNIVEIRFMSQEKERIFSTLVMPLFHPELLIINPNMKRTTWMDLQKSLSLLGKN